MSKIKYGGKNSSKKIKPSSKSMLLSANIDHMAFLIICYYGLHLNSGSVWLAPLSIEKYLKSVLLKENPNLDERELKKVGHNLEQLWKEVCNYLILSEISKDVLNEHIQELNSIDIDVRYSQAGIKISSQFMYLYLILSSLLRYHVIEKSGYEKYELYGLQFKEIPDSLNKGISDAKIILSRILHLIYEHGCSPFLGAVFDYEFHKLSRPPNYLSKNKKDSDCPICKEIVKIPITRESWKTVAKYFRGIK